ncbi:hypothetical protein LB542_29535 [Mesorhizobium sp. BR1-1-9]|uniref:hypothetical protein n=1 Tax=Mesorhizobium sp. BR1-1-9 TaxID=2876646 RepID=UPI001CD12496|nr:hypothetical protein [Mesorhizobium sp. BR1-1-9]MBZ9874978.1 hypothetical protein [Mesorhizobium sp. BR1-1-9]
MFDVFTGLPAEIEGHPYIDLEMDYAHEIAGILNAAARTEPAAGPIAPKNKKPRPKPSGGLN